VTAGQVDQMRALHIRSVEELAGCNDAALERIGMGARSLRDRARAYVENKKGSAVVEAALAARNEEVEQLRAQVAELTEAVKALAPRRGRPPKVQEEEAA
jgi:ubiquinone biosynthesis protein UbiJ